MEPASWSPTRLSRRSSRTAGVQLPSRRWSFWRRWLFFKDIMNGELVCLVLPERKECPRA